MLLILLFSLLASVTWSPMFLVDFHFLQSQVRSFSSGARESSLFYVKCIWCSDFFSFTEVILSVRPWCDFQVYVDQLFLSCPSSRM
jgi:hypothetical protein